MLKKIINNSFNNRDFWYMLALCIASFIFVLFNTSMSPLYEPSYITHDASVFYVMGRAMKEGLIPYKDLFDHKGLYIYFIYYLAALIGEKYSIGLFICFSLLACILSIFIYKLIRLFYDSLISFFSAFFLVVLSTSMMFSHNSILCEYPVLICIVISIYLLIKCIKNNVEFKLLYMLYNGILFSICLFTKANYCLYFLSIVIYIIYDFIVHRRKFVLLIKYFIFGVVGIIAGVLPVLLYCVVNDCLNEMIFSVFIFNFNYAGSMNIDLPKEVDTKFKSILFALQSYKNSILICMCSFVILIYKKVDKKIILFYLVSFIIVLFSIVFPGSGYTHYVSLLLPYFLPFIIALNVGFFTFFEVSRNKIRKLSSLFILLMFLFSVSLMIGKQFLHTNFSYTTKQCSEIKKELKKIVRLNSKIEFLCVGLGTSLYNYLEVIPHFKYYYIPSIPYKAFNEPMDALWKYISSGAPDVVLCSRSLVVAESGYEDLIYDYLENNYYRLKGNFDVNDYPIYIKKDIINNENEI